MIDEQGNVKPSLAKGAADGTLLSRRLIVSCAIATGLGLASQPSFAGQNGTGRPDIAVSEGGFRFIEDPGRPFSGGAAASMNHALVRVRLRDPRPLEQGLDFVGRYLAGAGRPPSALAGLELRAPAVMSRPGFQAFNKGYLAALRTRGFVTGQVVSVARSDMVPQYDPPTTDVLSAFTYAVPSDAHDVAHGTDFLLSGRPEYDGNHVIAPGDVSPAGMSRKARFVLEQLRQGVAALGGQWSDLTGVQIYMTEPLPLVMEALRDAGLTRIGLSLFPGSTPVDGYDGVRYAFEADVRAIGLEQVV